MIFFIIRMCCKICLFLNCKTCYCLCKHYHLKRIAVDCSGVLCSCSEFESCMNGCPHSSDNRGRHSVYHNLLPDMHLRVSFLHLTIDCVLTAWARCLGYHYRSNLLVKSIYYALLYKIKFLLWKQASHVILGQY